MKTKWPDGTPRSQGNAFCVQSKPSLMHKDQSYQKMMNSNAKKGVTERAKNNIYLPGSR